MAPVVPISMAPVVPTPVAMFGCPLAAVAAPFPTIIVVASVTSETNLSGRPIGWICQRRRCKPGVQGQRQKNLFQARKSVGQGKRVTGRVGPGGTRIMKTTRQQEAPTHKKRARE